MTQENPVAGVAPIERIVVRTRRRIRVYRVLTGLAWAVGATCAWLILTAGLDMLTPMSVWLRVMAWAVFWTAAASLLGLAVLWPWFKPMPLADVAFRIERTLPGMHNRLVTVLDLRHRNGSAKLDSEGFVQRLIQQTQTRLAPYRIAQVASPRPLRRGIVGAGTALLAGAALLFFCSDRMPTALARMFHPLADIAPASWVKFHAEPGNLEVLQGDPATLRLVFDRGQADDPTVRLRATSPSGTAWTNYPMKPDVSGQPAFTLSAVDGTLEYQMFAGGTWTRQYTITMIRRPIVESLGTSVLLPEYMGLPEPRVVPDEAAQVSAPIGATILLDAQVSGDPVRGQVRLFKATAQSAKETHEQELVWYEDATPADAEVEGKWQWTTAQIYSGTRAYSFDWKRQPFGFKTRLSPLALDTGNDFFVYAWLDPQDPPRDIRVTLFKDATPVTMVWHNDTPAPKTTSPVVPAAAAPVPTVPPAPAASPAAINYHGKFPPVGKWMRLDVPFTTDPALKALLGAAPTVPAHINGIRFATDTGRVIFGRAGALSRSSTTAQTIAYAPTAAIPMERDTGNPQAGHWIGKVPVKADCCYTVEFFSVRNDPNPAMKPRDVVALVDQPPRILVDSPGKSITIPEAQPVPLMLRADDDYGIADVGIQVGPSADHLQAPRWISHFDQPHTRELVISSLDPRLMAIAPGQSAYYRAVARDRKGQIGQSEVFRLGLAAAGSAQAAGVEKGMTPLKPLLDGIAKLVSVQGKLAAEAAKLIGDLPAGIIRKVENGRTVKLINADGTEVTAEQIQKMLQDRYAHMTPDEKKELAKLDREATQGRLDALALSQQLDSAAEVAQLSALAMPMESQALRDMADQARDMAAQQPDEPGKPDAAVLQRLEKLDELTPQQQKEMADLTRQLQDLERARQTAATQPGQAQQQMMAMMAGMQAGWAMRQMGQLQAPLASQQQQLEALRQQIEGLHELAKSAKPQDLEKISKQEQALDAKSLELLHQAQDLLRERMAGQADQDNGPPEPWMAPGEHEDQLPTELDTPDKKKKKGDMATTQGGPDAKEEEAKNWWDRPVDQMPIGRTGEADPRYRDNQAAVEAGDNTPRGMLRRHQDEFTRSLDQQRRAMAAAGQAVGEMQAQMQALMDQLHSGKADAESVARQLAQMMNSPNMRWAAAAAQRSAMAAAGQQMTSQASAAAMAGQTTPGQAMFGGMRTGNMPIMSMDLSGIDITHQPAAGLYRLPPRMRQPLLQSMQERGPEGYQPLIDAYYRMLNEEAK